MDRNLGDWIQLAVSIAMVVGLVLVVVELQQAKQLAHVDIMSQHFIDVGESLRNTTGEHASRSIARSCIDPDSLTPEDYVVLDQYYRGLLTEAARLGAINSVADEFGIGWEGYAYATSLGRSSAPPLSGKPFASNTAFGMHAT